MKFRWEKHALRGEKTLEGSDAGNRTKHDRAESDSATLVRRFDRLRAASDDRNAGDIYETIAAELKSRRLRLSEPMKATRGAVARKIQRYRRPLR